MEIDKHAMRCIVIARGFNRDALVALSLGDVGTHNAAIDQCNHWLRDAGYHIKSMREKAEQKILKTA